jgi:hypothetical protein
MNEVRATAFYGDSTPESLEVNIFTMTRPTQGRCKSASLQVTGARKVASNGPWRLIHSLLNNDFWQGSFLKANWRNKRYFSGES